MGMYVESESNLIEGTKGCLAQIVRDDAGVAKGVEVWDEDAEQHFGNLPADVTGLPPRAVAALANELARAWRAGRETGITYGEFKKLSQIQNVLGIPDLVRQITRPNDD
jgi:hypothetical protein